MQELPGRDSRGVAGAQDQYRRLRLQGPKRVRDTESDQQDRDCGAQDRDRADETEGGDAAETPGAEEGSVYRVPGEERGARHAGEERIAGGTRERGKTDDIDRDRAIGFAYWATRCLGREIVAIYYQP